MPANPQHANYISQVVDATNRLIDARSDLKALRERNTANGMIAALVAPDDFAGTNAYLTPADLTNLFATMDKLESVFTDFTKTPPAPTADLTNLLKLRP